MVLPSDVDIFAATDTASRFCVYWDTGVLKAKNNLAANQTAMIDLKFVTIP